MKAHYRSADNRITVEISAETPKDLFRQIAQLQEILEDEPCGLCQSERIHFRVRTADGNEFYEFACLDCFAVLAFGQHKTGGTLFARRRGDDSQPLPHRGWRQWSKPATPFQQDTTRKAGTERTR